MIKKYPYFLKATVILFGLILFVFAISTLQEILVPLSFALLLSILLNPLSNWLQKKKFPRIAAIAIALLLGMIFISAIVYFISTQLSSFSDQLPMLKKKFAELFMKLQYELSQHFNFPLQNQNKMIAQAESGIQPMIAKTLGTVMGSIAIIFLLPVYTFLFLFYKTLLLNFLYEVFDEKNSKEVESVLSMTKGAIQNYMVGLVIEGIIVAILNTFGLFIFGIQYAVLLGVLGAILNVLPFIGGILSVLLPLIIATVTKDGFHTQLGIIIAYLIIQFIDNHFLVPYIVSSKVKINALISIVIVLMGGAVWGISGMFLSIPFIGILKIIFDKIPELSPWGKVLGTHVPAHHKGEIWKLRRRRTKKV
jgi:predicted PurR-regulated permease PerM